MKCKISFAEKAQSWFEPHMWRRKLLGVVLRSPAGVIARYGLQPLAGSGQGVLDGNGGFPHARCSVFVLHAEEA